jgi:hypothetical protein
MVAKVGWLTFKVKNKKAKMLMGPVSEAIYL